MDTLTTPSNGSPRNGQSVPGAHFDPVIALIREANHVMSCYTRWFAGKERATRDLRMLAELGERLTDIRERLTTLPDAADRARAATRLATLDEQIALLAGERQHILAARDSGSLAERSAWLATRINDQFVLYRTHFAGQTRTSRRPGLIGRIIANLEEIAVELADPAFAALGDRTAHDANQALVAGNLVKLRRERDMVELERQASSVAERVAALGLAANNDIRAYNSYFAGQDRSTRPLGLLGQICDRLAEIERELAELLHTYRSDAIVRSLDAVQIGLDLYDSEHEQIAAVQRAAA